MPIVTVLIKLYITDKGDEFAGATSHYCLAVTGPTALAVRMRLMALVATTFLAIERELPGELIVDTPAELLEPFRGPGSEVHEISVRNITLLNPVPPLAVRSGEDVS